MKTKTAFVVVRPVGAGLDATHAGPVVSSFNSMHRLRTSAVNLVCDTGLDEAGVDLEFWCYETSNADTARRLPAPPANQRMRISY